MYVGGDNMVTLLEKDFYSVKEVADYFGVTKQAVSKWIKEDKLKSSRIAGTTIRVARKDLMKLIEEGK